MSNGQEFMNEAIRLIECAKNQNVVLRLIGALAIRHHCPKFLCLHEALEREFSDIDFLAYGKQAAKIGKVMDEAGYAASRHGFTVGLVGGRLIFANRSDGKHVDVFLDRLAMCHTIDFKGKLEIDFPTISLADLVLEKMQIVRIAEKDIIDMIVLIREHELGNGSERIDIGYISKFLSKDWGFYYTVTTNLRKLNTLLDNFPALCDADKRDVSGKIKVMLDKIEKEPKSMSWKLRERMGTNRKWYRDVEQRA